MKLKNRKKTVSTIIITIFFTLLSFNIVFAANMGGLLKKAGESEGAGFKPITDDTAISQYLGSIIQYALSFLGVIFIILIIYGGFLWMTAQGEEEQITRAKDIIKNSVIGLVIVLGSYTITYFIFVEEGLSFL